MKLRALVPVEGAFIQAREHFFERILAILAFNEEKRGKNSFVVRLAWIRKAINFLCEILDDGMVIWKFIGKYWTDFFFDRTVRIEFTSKKPF